MNRLELTHEQSNQMLDLWGKKGEHMGTMIGQILTDKTPVQIAISVLTREESLQVYETLKAIRSARKNNVGKNVNV